MTSPLEHPFYEHLFYHKNVSGNETKIQFGGSAQFLYDREKGPGQI
jgi:hypothetical protein